MKRILLIIILISGFILTQAQKSKTDSLRRILQTQKQDTNRVNTILNLAYLYIAIPDTSLQLSMEALELSTSLNYKKGINQSLGFIAVAYAFTGNYPQALNSLFKALKIDEAEHDTAAIAGAYNLLGALYKEQGNYGEALKYLTKGLSISQNGALFLNISETYSNMHVLDSASIYAHKGLYQAIQSGSADFLQWAYGRTAATYQDEGKYKLARTYYDSSLSTNLKYNLSPWLAYLGLASLFEKTGQLDSSLYYARLCMAEVRQTGLYNARKKAIPILTSVFEKMHNADSALFYMKLEKAVNDSMFSQQKLSQLQSLAFNQKMQEKEKEEAVRKAKETLRNQVIIFSLLGALIVFGTIAIILYRNNKQKQKANRLLQKQKQETDEQKQKAESALEELKSTQAQLIQSEKMASLGELTAGIAHEIQNPLNFVNNFSEVNKEMLTELNEEIDKGNYDDAKAIAKDVIDNEQKINHHGKRADAIVKGMLQHSRANSGNKEPTDINGLAEEYLRLAYHGLRAKDKSFNADFKTSFDDSLGKINIVPQDIGRVLLNLYNNAFYAVNEKKKLLNGTFEPLISVTTAKKNGSVILKVTDNGNGIPPDVTNKIFQPFFTTKPTGQGTGLGLSLSYDIIKAHGGEIQVTSKESGGTEFTINIPIT